MTTEQDVSDEDVLSVEMAGVGWSQWSVVVDDEGGDDFVRRYALSGQASRLATQAMRKRLE